MVMKFTQEEEALGYRFNLVGRHLLVTQVMKDYALKKLSKIERLSPHIIDVYVTLDIQKLDHSCVIVLNLSHYKIKVAGVSTDMYASIDMAVDKLQSKIRRWKKKMQDHNKQSRSSVDMQIAVLQAPFDPLNEINEEIEILNNQILEEQYRPHKIIGNETRPLKVLTTDEAIMKMELSDDQFLLFKSEEDLRLKVIYRRNDGNYGLICPE